MIFGSILEKDVLMLASEAHSFFWKTNFCGYQVEKSIFKRFSRVKKCNYVILTCFAIWGIINIPIWGSQDEWMLAKSTFNTYFSTFGKPFYFIYFSTFPMLAFSAIRFSGLLLYGMLQEYVQTILINQKIIEISYSSDNVIADKTCQNNIHTTLCLCISHHADIKK